MSVPLIPREALFGNPDRANPQISPDGTRWAFCDRPRPFGDAVLWAGPIGEAEDLALPSDCHHPTLDVDGEIAWAQFGDGSSLRLHSARGLPLDFDGLRQPRSTLWHPRIDPSGSWVTMVASTSSDIGPVTVLDRNSGEVWQTVRESRGGWRDVNDGTLAAATSDGILMVGLNRRVDEHWSVFHHFGDACDALADDWPCDLTPREVGLSAAGRVAVATAPARGSDRWDGWPLVLVDGPVAGETVCLQLTLYDADFGVCCGLGDEELCLVIPECDCAIDESWEIVCIDEAAGIYEMQFDLVNLSPDVVEHVFLVTDPGAPYAFDEDHFDVPATAPFGTMSVGPVTITTSLAPGDIIPFVATLHVQNLAECCDLPMEITLPSCEGESNGHPADLDGNGVVDGPDLTIILGGWD